MLIALYYGFIANVERQSNGSGIYFMVRQVDISSPLIPSKHCDNESGDCIYPGRRYVS